MSAELARGALVAIDAGRSEVEVKTKNGLKTFPSAVAEMTEPHLNPQWIKGDLEIVYKGRRWMVGQLALREGRRFKKQNYGKSKADITLVIQMIAACIYSGITVGPVNLGTLVPILGYTKEERKSIRELLRGEHDFTYELVEENKQKPVVRTGRIFVNSKILISQEGATGYWSSPQAEPVQTFDFGAYTINLAYHDYIPDSEIPRVYINDKSTTIYDGWAILKQKNGFEDVHDQFIPLEKRRGMAEQLVGKAVDMAKQLGWNENTKTQVLGGVADDAFEYVLKKFPRAYMVAQPRNANVIGLYNLMTEVFPHE